MDKQELSYGDFLESVEPEYREYADRTHNYLLENGCKIKLRLAKNGYLVSYSYVGAGDKRARVIANFAFRKGALIIRIYGDNVSAYPDFLDGLPEEMTKSIEKAPVCKRLFSPADCNSKCGMGYDFTLKGARHQKCKYNCFMFDVNDENIPFIEAFLENEIEARAAA